jgi:hypothetical protein
MNIFLDIIIFQPVLVANIKKYCSHKQICFLQQTSIILHQQFSFTLEELDDLCRIYLSRAKPYFMQVQLMNN